MAKERCHRRRRARERDRVGDVLGHGDESLSATGMWVGGRPESSSRPELRGPVGVRSGQLGRYGLSGEEASMESPEEAAGTKGLHDPSGTAVSPGETLISTVVPVGVSADQDIASESASVTRRRPEEGNGPGGRVRRHPHPVDGHVLAARGGGDGLMFWAMVTCWVSTTWPSMRSQLRGSPDRSGSGAASP